MKAKNIFEKPEDYQDWDKLAQHCEILEELTEVEKEKAKRAFLFLKRELGEDFLSVAFDTWHPLASHITNLAPWTRKWLSWFAEALKELKNHHNYKSLLIRLKDKDKFSEALSVLEPSYKFAKVKFKLDFDPKVAVGLKEKIPDFKITNSENREELFVEVSILKESMIQKEAGTTLQEIQKPILLFIPFVYYCGRVHKTLSERHLKEVTEKVQQLVKRVKAENTFHELVEEGVVEMGLAPKGDKEMLEKWAAEKGLKVGEFSGPSYNVDELLRMKGKIKEEQKQLPHDHANIIVIKDNTFFFRMYDIRKAINELEEEMYRYPHLLNIVISGGYMGTGEPMAIPKDQHLFIRKIRTDILLVDECILLLNRYCNFDVSPSSIAKIYTALTQY